MNEKLKKITVRTVPNGYILEFDAMKQKGGYMYFSADKLLEGFMLHIGLGMTEQLNRETMQDFIVAACNWNENRKCVNEIQKLTEQLQQMTYRRNGLARRLVHERNRFIEIWDGLVTISKRIQNYHDKELQELVKNLTKGNHKVIPLRLTDLGVDSHFILPEDVDSDEDGDGCDGIA